MDTKQVAFNIFNGLNEEQLKKFISIFEKINIVETALPAKTEKRKAFEELDGMIRSVPSIDYDKELASHREEKYGQ